MASVSHCSGTITCWLDSSTRRATAVREQIKSADGNKRRTYLAEVERFANALKGLGVMLQIYNLTDSEYLTYRDTKAQIDADMKLAVIANTAIVTDGTTTSELSRPR